VAAHLRVHEALDDADVAEEQDARVTQQRDAAGQIPLVLLRYPGDLAFTGHGDRQVFTHQHIAPRRIIRQIDAHHRIERLHQGGYLGCRRDPGIPLANHHLFSLHAARC
jgi:hypothetical protein